MGSKSNSSTASNQTTKTTTKTTQLNLQDVDGVAVGGGGNVKVNITDGGAVAAGFDFGSDALSTVDNVIETGFAYLSETAENAVDRVSSYADKSLQEVSNATRSDTAETLQTLTKYIAGAVALTAVAYAVMRK